MTEKEEKHQVLEAQFNGFLHYIQLELPEGDERMACELKLAEARVHAQRAVNEMPGPEE